eukprot:92333_1
MRPTSSEILILLSLCIACNAHGIRPGCVHGVNYDTALAHCNSFGSLRLCTLDEINAEVGKGSGCGFDGYHLWTSTECGANQHWIAITGSAVLNYDPTLKSPECTDDTSTTSVNTLYFTNIAVQCCVLSDAPSGYPTMVPSSSPTDEPSTAPTKGPTNQPSLSPSKAPTKAPTNQPSMAPTKGPTYLPSWSPTNVPSSSPRKDSSDSYDSTDSSDSNDYNDSGDSSNYNVGHHLNVQDVHGLNESDEDKFVYFNVSVGVQTVTHLCAIAIIIVFSNIFMYFYFCKKTTQ